MDLRLFSGMKLRTKFDTIKSSNSMSWAPRDTFGYNTKFEEIQASRFGSVESGYNFSGDLIGRDNWLAVCNSDREGVLEPKNYPAFYFAYNYGSDFYYLNSEFNVRVRRFQPHLSPVEIAKNKFN